jgi:Helix-turn-helix domain
MGVKRAVELFTFKRRSTRSPMVEQTWQTRSEPEQSFISVAVSHWEMVVTTRQSGDARLTVRGPETRATTAPIPEDADFFGIQFSPGTFMPALPPGQLRDRSLTLPMATKTSFWFAGSRLEFPGPDNVDAFVERLAWDGLLVHDPVAATAVNADIHDLSTRSVERRVARATGLTRGAIRQIRRAELAVQLLSRGVPALDVVHQAGYADQPHLTRSLKRLVGLTPTQIVASAAG